MKKFFEPMRGEMKPIHTILNVIGGFGIFIPIYLAPQNKFLIGAAIYLLWYALVWFVYLTFCYFKNNHKKQ